MDCSCEAVAHEAGLSVLNGVDEEAIAGRTSTAAALRGLLSPADDVSATT